MKWIFLAAAICASIGFSPVLKQRSDLRRLAWMAFGLLPFLLQPLHLYMALRSWPAWPGYVKGIEVTLLDILAVGLYLSLPTPRSAVPFKIPMLIYATVVLLSCFQSDSFEISFGYLVQLGRVFLVYAVVAKASSDEQLCDAILRGMTIGICFQAIVVVVQRLALGQLQTTGTFEHQNSLGIASHFLAFPLFALFLARKPDHKLPLIALSACVVVEILTVSRATIGLAAVGFLIVFVVSSAQSWSSRKASIAIVGLIALGLLVPIAMTSFSARSVLTEESDYDERAAFERAAAAVLADNPLGVGPNNYVIVVNTQGYNDRAGVVPTSNSLSAHVHNVYYLVVAETGWIGLTAYLSFLLAPLIYAVRQCHRLRKTQQGDLLLGFATSLLIVFLHSLYEWTFITWTLQYFGAIAAGLIVGTSRQLAVAPGSVYQNVALATGSPNPVVRNS
jgi:O-antigen ligase